MNNQNKNTKVFFSRTFNTAPERLQKEIGHFNVFYLDPYSGKYSDPTSYQKRDYYKIMLMYGGGGVHFADKAVGVEKQALTFSNPLIPYKWEQLDRVEGGVFCVFDESFFHGFGDIKQYSVFQPSGSHVFELTDQQTEKVSRLFDRMFEEINSGYIHKYDLLRNLVFELIHFATKTSPSSSLVVLKIRN